MSSDEKKDERVDPYQEISALNVPGGSYVSGDAVSLF